MNNIFVTVKNRLEENFGNRPIAVKEDDQPLCSVFPGNEEVLPQIDNDLQSIDLEVMAPQSGITGNNVRIPISIESAHDYLISAIRHESLNKWRIEFEAPATLLKAGGEEEPKPVNVTLGQDEPPTDMTFKALMCKALPAAVAYLVSPFILKLSTPLWIAVPIVSLIGGTVFWLFSKKKTKIKKEVDDERT